MGATSGQPVFIKRVEHEAKRFALNGWKREAHVFHYVGGRRGQRLSLNGWQKEDTPFSLSGWAKEAHVVHEMCGHRRQSVHSMGGNRSATCFIKCVEQQAKLACSLKWVGNKSQTLLSKFSKSTKLFTLHGWNLSQTVFIKWVETRRQTVALLDGWK